jgi:DNA polymerase-1
MKGTLVFDIESHEADAIHWLEPEEFVRLSGYKWVGKDDVFLTSDLEEIREVIRSARYVIGHNIIMFDLPAIFGTESDEWLEMVDSGKVLDTWVHATQVNPAPYTYINRFGKKALADKPEKMKAWYALDEQAHQLGVVGKTHNLADLAKEFGDPSLPAKLRLKDGFGKIPIDDERFREYLTGDVLASEAVAEALLKKGEVTDYIWREHRIQSRAAVIHFNGFRVDQEKAQARVDELAARRQVILDELVEKYNFPTEGKAPWSTTEGKEAIMAALKDHGITPKTVKNWTRTATGNLSLGGEVLKEITAGTPAEDLGVALAELKGQRSLAQLALDSMYPDGFVHPEITMLQRSGRWSTTKPGLTVWTARGPGAKEKEYFLPDFDDHVLLEIDYSNADARGVAAISGDKEYAKRFEPGEDGHKINAIIAWGEEVVMSDLKKYRQMAKPLGHGWGYSARAKKLAAQTGTPLADAERFVSNMDAKFKYVVGWQNRVRQEGYRGYVTNLWGRKMKIEDGRAYTQAPALIGQSTTREIVCDALLRMPYHILRMVKAQIHDALLFSVPAKYFEEAKKYLCELMTTTLSPPRGLKMEFPVDAGPPGKNWYEAGH